eukprot:GHVP01024165.1.p1 GENE.GHVP01024165.1~~GHVP01024165.1.p1  ORF type:complete len:310 (+),score=69.26 GHVP01024165.1:780-1709(+)
MVFDFSSMLGGGMGKREDVQVTDTSETIRISGLALIKMLRHGRAGVPMEVMGLLLGSFVDEYTIEVVDVFAMPQSGTSVTVESVDPVFQMKMLEMLQQTGRPEMVVGWYHSHPGFGCWLSQVDVDTQMSFETLNKRSVAVVIDPIQSVRGKVVLDAFRSIPSQMILSPQEVRQTTSVKGHLKKPSIVALIHGLNRAYYSLNIEYTLSEKEENLLLKSNRREWTEPLKKDEDLLKKTYENRLVEMEKASKLYAKAAEEELHLKPEERRDRYIGKRDPKKHLETEASSLIVDETLSLMSEQARVKILNTVL